MIKKLLFIAVLLGCVSVQAQQVSNWKLHPTKSTTPGIVLESMSDMVYYMSGSNLFFYDKETNEIGTLNSGNYLSDSGIKNIYYNYEKGYLMIVYQNSNIDLVFDKRHNRVLKRFSVFYKVVSVSNTLKSLTLHILWVESA